MKNKPTTEKTLTPKPDALFDRVVDILEQAQNNVVRAVNTNMVLAYWSIGREIVQELQGGEERAAYGKQVVEMLSARLMTRYGKGFSFTNLWYFRQFYLAFQDRVRIPHPVGGESRHSAILHPPGGESSSAENLFPAGRDLNYQARTKSAISRPAGAQSQHAFAPQLSWSHYRALMRVTNIDARDFYEREASESGWSKVQLEHQIHSYYFDRIISNRGKQGLLPDGREPGTSAR